ncbi:MAG: GreA/GreB family elongation factor [Elusimicrobia bacterium]|nr:GreA/GreB family elongation factor [Elusimicrobiota bacterium]
MSRAFVKEDAGGPDEDPPERPVSPHPNYVTPRGARLLQQAEERLVAELQDLSGAQADPARRKKKRELERDLRYVRARLETAIPADPAAAPKDEVRFGARVRLRREGGGERTIRIVGEDEAEEGGEFVPWTGPFMQALLGLKAGQVLEWEGPEGPEGWTVVSIEY